MVKFTQIKLQRHSPMCKCTSWMRHPTSGLPEFGNIIVQVGNSRLGCAGPESITPNRGYGFRARSQEFAPRNDGVSLSFLLIRRPRNVLVRRPERRRPARAQVVEVGLACLDAVIEIGVAGVGA